MDKDLLEKAIQLRHDLHRHAELSLKEKKTVEILKAFLKKNAKGLEIVDEDGWFYAVKNGSGSQKIAFRADMDGLPIAEQCQLDYASINAGVSHKCGHDGHSATLALLACLVSSMPTEKDVYFVFQPAEEIGAGGKPCALKMKQLGVQEIYAFHNLPGYPSGKLVYRHGLSQPASVGITVKAIGRKSHASDPEHGINPSYFLADLIELIKEESEKPHEGMLLCTIVNVDIGSRDFGISAGQGELSFTLRAENESEMDGFQKMICQKAAEMAKAQDLKLEITETDRFPETRNNERCLTKVLQAARKAGIETMEMNRLWRASEDFGNYLKIIDGAIFYLGSGTEHPALHTAEYDFSDELIEKAAKIFMELINSKED